MTKLKSVEEIMFDIVTNRNAPITSDLFRSYIKQTLTQRDKDLIEACCEVLEGMKYIDPLGDRGKLCNQILTAAQTKLRELIIKQFMTKNTPIKEVYTHTFTGKLS